MKKNISEYIILAIIIVAQFTNIIYWGNKKEGFFGDEILSYFFVCQTDYPFISADRPEMNYLNNWHDSLYYQDYLTITDDETFDLSGAYKSAARDVHPPVFFLLLDIACSLAGGSFSKWPGIGINIFFFALTIWFLYKLTREITDSALICMATCIVYGFSVGAVSTAIFIRMYMILTAATVLFCYLHAKLWNTHLNQDERGLYIGIALTFLFGFLTQYYFIISAFFICAVYFLFILIQKKYRIAVKYVITMSASLIVSLIIWPSAYNHIFHGYRGKEAFNNLKNGNENLREYINIASKALFSQKSKTFFVIVVLLIIVWLFRLFFDIAFNKGDDRLSVSIIRKQNLVNSFTFEVDSRFWIVFSIMVAVTFDIYIIAKIAPFQTDRYIFNVLPLIVLLVVFIITYLCTHIFKIKIINYMCIAVIMGLMILGYKTVGVSYLYLGTESKIEISDQYAELPVILLLEENSSVNYRSACESIYFQNGQRVYPTKENGMDTIYDALENIDEGSQFVLYVDKSFSSVDDVLDAVKQEVNATSSNWIYDTGRSAVYIIER